MVLNIEPQINNGHTQHGPKSSQIYSLKSGGSHNFKPMSSRKNSCLGLLVVLCVFLMTSRAQELFQAGKSSHLQLVAPHHLDKHLTFEDLPCDPFALGFRMVW